MGVWDVPRLGPASTKVCTMGAIGESWLWVMTCKLELELELCFGSFLLTGRRFHIVKRKSKKTLDK